MGRAGLIGGDPDEGLPSSFLGWPRCMVASVLADRGRPSGREFGLIVFAQVARMSGLKYFRG